MLKFHRNKGEINDQDINRFIKTMGGNVNLNGVQPFDGSIHVSSFVKKISDQIFETICASWSSDSKLMSFVQWNNIMNKGFVDHLVKVSDDETAIAFIRYIKK
jgi:hypothetical protein